MVTIDDVRAFALQLPGATERPSYGGRPSWRAGPRMFAWVREDPEALVVWVDSVEDKEALIASAPDRFFTTDHYDGHPVVLVSLETVEHDEADEVIRDSWCLRAPKKLVTAHLATRDGPSWARSTQEAGNRTGGGVRQPTESRSTTKTSVSLGAITPPAPDAP